MKVTSNLQGIVLKSQLYGQASNQCTEISKDQLKSEHGVELIISAVYLRDIMSVIAKAYDGFRVLMSTRRGVKELLKHVETRFSATASSSIKYRVL